MAIFTDFDAIPRLSYDLIMADPPWRFRNWSKKGEGRNAVSHYRCLELPEILALPVGDLAGKNCLLWLWATNPMLPQALNALEAWGFTFKTCGVWVKRTKNWKIQFGTGYVLRSSHEPFLIGTIGNVKTSRSVRSVLEARVGAHSAKPAEGFATAEHLVPGAMKRIELFSRNDRAGWDVFGDEVQNSPVPPENGLSSGQVGVSGYPSTGETGLGASTALLDDFENGGDAA